MDLCDNSISSKYSSLSLKLSSGFIRITTFEKNSNSATFTHNLRWFWRRCGMSSALHLTDDQEMAIYERIRMKKLAEEQEEQTSSSLSGISNNSSIMETPPSKSSSILSTDSVTSSASSTASSRRSNSGGKSMKLKPLYSDEISGAEESNSKSPSIAQYCKEQRYNRLLKDSFCNKTCASQKAIMQNHEKFDLDCLCRTWAPYLSYIKYFSVFFS